MKITNEKIGSWRDWVVLVFVILLLPSFIFGIFEGLITANYSRFFANLLLSTFAVYVGLKYVRGIFKDRSKNQKFFKDTKIRNKMIVLVGLTIIVWGWYLSIFLSPFFEKSKSIKINPELESIISGTNSTILKVRSDIAAHQTCFGDESLEQRISAECVIAIKDIQETFRGADNENLGKLELYYQNNTSDIDNVSKNLIENSLRLYKSNFYLSLMNEYDRYFSAYIKWHEYFRDIVGTKGVDNMTDSELMKAKTLAQEIVDSEEKLQSSANQFTDYLNNSFDKDFIEAIQNI
ncbi:MAG: hypothetical protein HYT63_03040 [Candidatus Yanofskybacteria bacterium]|nr:hypothetical protein [Candidatus Yanofskybacteria bacterium]